MKIHQITYLHVTHAWLPSILPMKWDDPKTSCVAHLAHSVWCLRPSGRNLGTLCSQVMISAVPKCGVIHTPIQQKRRNFWTNNVVMPFEIKNLPKYVRLSIWWLKAPSLTFAEKFVPQDFTISAAPVFMGPANTCYWQIQWFSFCKSVCMSAVHVFNWQMPKPAW